jgi:hypothetical protein
LISNNASKNKVKQNLKQSKGCVCEKLPLQRSSTSSPATVPEKLDAAELMMVFVDEVK